MTRDEVRELHYIAPIQNIPSILQYGILSHRRAVFRSHKSVALLEVQDIRKKKRVPGGRKLHEYANLYFNARNPMMYRRRVSHESLCIVRIDPSVLDGANVIITDGNAASDYTRFLPSPAGLGNVDGERLFARYWVHRSDEIDTWSHRREICAEALVPDRVKLEHLMGAYVSTTASFVTLTRMVDTGFRVRKEPYLFFR